MKLRDILTKETYDKYGIDMDVYSDCIDEAAACWCGTLLTDLGKEAFDDVLDLPATITVETINGIEDGYITVCTGHLKKCGTYWNKAKELFDSMAGYCSDTLWDAWFCNPEYEPEPDSADPERLLRRAIVGMMDHMSLDQIRSIASQEKSYKDALELLGFNMELLK